MKVRCTQIALTAFEDAHDYIAKENPNAAHTIAHRIVDATAKLLEYPYIGRIGEDEDTREWQVQHTPYMLVYQIRGEAIEILRVYHNKRAWPPT